MLTTFELRYPGLIRFGWGCRQELPAAMRELTVGATPRALLLCSRSFAQTASFAELRALAGGEACTVFTEVRAEPELAVVDAVAALAREHGAGLLVAAGGGSVMDVGKAAAVVAAGGPAATTADYFHGRRPVAGPLLPLIVLPTTAGSGAEITCNAVLTDPAVPVKKSLRSPAMVPRVALVDPELTVSLPSEQTAWSGLDALTQAVESYLSTRANAASRALARDAAALLLHWLPAAVRNGQDREARTGVAQGSLLSGMAFSQSSLGAVHGLAHPLGLGLGVAHGLTCAILLPHVLELNAEVTRADQDTLGAACGVRDGEGFRAAIRELCAAFGVPIGFTRWGLCEAQFPAILATCRSASMQTNPRPLSDPEIVALLRRLAT